MEDQICDQNSVIGSGQQNCNSVEICDTVEEEICTEENGNTMQVLLRQECWCKNYIKPSILIYFWRVLSLFLMILGNFVEYSNCCHATTASNIGWI